MPSFLSLDSLLILRRFLTDVSIGEEPSAGNKTFRISHCFNVNQCVNIENCAFLMIYSKLVVTSSRKDN